MTPRYLTLSTSGNINIKDKFALRLTYTTLHLEYDIQLVNLSYALKQHLNVLGK